MADKQNCPLRHKNGNCLPIGGFCTAVNDSICEGLHMAFEHGRSNPQWISVKDELPRTGRSVLVYVRRDDGVDTWYRTIAWMGEKNWDSCDPYFSAKKDKITHWMPLPEPPKGDDE